MLQAIREKAGSFIVKILFLLLIASFAVWGIGDIFRNKSGETIVAKIGDRSIRADELQVAVRDELTRLRSMLGGTLDIEQAKQLGLIDTTLNRIVTRELVQLEADRLGLAVGDEAVRRAIQADPTFHNAAGTFDRSIYNRVLSLNRMNEVLYEQRLRRDMVRGDVVDAITAGAVAPPLLVAPLFQQRNEKRVADWAFLPLEAAGDVGEPGDADIAEYYEKNNDRFRAPEYRGFTALVLTPDAVAKDIDVPEQRLREEYQARISEFETPERREIEQIVVPDEGKARLAAVDLAGGKDFLEVAKEIDGGAADSVKLGWVKRDEMPTELADAAFAAEPGKPTEPVQSPFGWHILKITAVEPAKVETFEEARTKLREAVTRELAADYLFKLSNEVEDALAAGKSLDDVSKQVGVALSVVEAVDPGGKTPTGDPVTLPPGGEQILRAAFDSSQGQVSRMAETREGNYYMLRVDKIVPSAIQPLAEVRDRIAALWKAEKQSEKVAAQAKEIAEAATGGKTLAELAGERGLKVQTTEPFLRTGAGAAGLPGPLVGQLFAAQPGSSVTSPGPGGSFVAQLKSVDRPEPTSDAKAMDVLSRQLQANIREDIMSEFERTLRARYGVSIKESELARLF